MTTSINNPLSIEDSLLRQCLRSDSITYLSEQVSGCFTFKESFPGFAGHFIDQPVLPAVAQLAAVRILASTGLKKQLRLCSVQKAKFKSIIIPGHTIHITINVSENNSYFTLNFKLLLDNKVAAIGELLCREGIH